MAVPNQYLQQVQTYNESNLAMLLNMYCFLSTANKKFEKFNDDIPKQLGDSVLFDLPPRMNSTNSLVVSFQAANQRFRTLTVDQPGSVAYSFTAQQFIFNVRDYMDKFGRSAVSQLGSKIEQDVASVAESQTFKFFGDGITPISTYLQLATALARHDEFGAAKTNKKGYLSNMTYPAIINSGLSQFAPRRNDREAMSWEIGEFGECEWYRSNLLKVHRAGTVGNTPPAQLTVVSTTLNAAGEVIAITFSGAPASDPNAIKKYDKFMFLDGFVRNIRFLTFIGGSPSEHPVQFAAAADAASNAGGQVTVSLTRPLLAGIPNDEALGITDQIVANMKVVVLPDHRCGLITSGGPLMLALPRLPEEIPYPTSVVTDQDSGASLRTYMGSLFGQNQRGMVTDAIWGKTLVDEYSTMIALPV
jgi:hypothetical protein